MKVVFDRASVKKILDDYQSLVGVRIGLFDKDYHQIYCVPEKGEAFCRAIRQNDEINLQCNLCDKKAFLKAQKSKKIHIYQCHIGLYEAIAPIIDDDVVIGYIMVGQILDDRPIGSQWDLIKQKCKAYGLEANDYEQAFYELQQLQKSKIEAISNIMCACSAYIWLKNIIHIERGGLFLRIDSFIRNNLKNKISQEDICKAINISKTTLYNCLISNVNMSTTNYIQKLRLEQAKLLLTNPNMKIHEIADEIGVDDYNYFSRIFKKTYGMTPSNYRKDKLKLSI